MPPQPGLFAVESHFQSSRVGSSSSRKPRAPSHFQADDDVLMHDRVKIIRGNAGGIEKMSTAEALERSMGGGTSYKVEGSSKKKREVNERVSKFGRDLSDRRDEVYGNSITILSTQARVLHAHPGSSQSYNVRLYPLTLERAALLESIELEELYGLETARMNYEEEKEKIEDDWKRARERLKEKITDSLEERRRRAREERDGDGVVAPADVLDNQGSGATKRKRGRRIVQGEDFVPYKLATPTPYGQAMDDINSPYPQSLMAIQPPANLANGRKRQPRGAGREVIPVTLGKATGSLTMLKEGEIESDLQDIRRGMKRRRAAAKASGTTVL